MMRLELTAAWTLVFACLTLGQVQECPTDWTRLKGKCLYFGEDFKNFTEATAYCQSINGRLFEPENEPSNGLVAKRARLKYSEDDPEYWVGITDDSDEGNWVFATSQKSIPYNSWTSGQPDNADSNQDCAYVFNVDGNWKDEDCSITKKYVCEDLSQIGGWTACRPGWDLINKKCYKKFDKALRFEVAEDLCHSYGATLFTPNYEAEQAAVEDFYSPEDPVWLGISDSGSIGRFYRVSDKTSVMYTDWSEQAEFVKGKQCAVLANSTWDTFDCNCPDLAQPICQELTGEECPIEAGWHKILSRCFFFSQNKTSYSDAIETCVEKGGRLFEPKNAMANDLIYDYVIFSHGIPFWIGIARDSSDSSNATFLYESSHLPIVYKQWDDDEPDYESVKANCVCVKDHKGNWGDLDCRRNRNYVCERPLSYHPFWDQASLDSKTQEAVDYIFDTIYHHEENCAEEPEEPEDPEGPEEPETPGPAFRFLIFGGFNEFERVQESVWLIDLETNTSCLHSNMPDGLKEPFVYELQNGELMVCSAFTEMDKSNLNCWTWSPLRGWQELATPEDNGVATFISSVYVPDFGPFFIDDVVNNSLLYNETSGNWTNFHPFTQNRARACSVLFNGTKVAHVGGTGTPSYGETIDVYDFATGVETLNVATMNFNRKLHSCALIPNGIDGHETVAIIGDNSSPFPFVMELWDTVTNTITEVDHPPGFENSRFFKPVVTTYNDTSILFSGGEWFRGTGPSLEMNFTETMFLYNYEHQSWTDLGKTPPPFPKLEQFGIYFPLNNPDFDAFVSLNRCAYE